MIKIEIEIKQADNKGVGIAYEAKGERFTDREKLMAEKLMEKIGQGIQEAADGGRVVGGEIGPDFRRDFERIAKEHGEDFAKRLAEFLAAD